MTIIPGTYLPETYNFTVAAVIGLVIVGLVALLIASSSRSRSVRRRPV